MRTSIEFGWETQERPQYCITKTQNSIKIPTAYLCIKEMGIINKIQGLPVRVQNFSGKRHRHSWKPKPPEKRKQKQSVSLT